MSLTRKEFLRSVVGATAGAAGAALLVACGGEDGTVDAGEKRCVMNGTSTTITANHGHVLTVSRADVMAGALKVYNIEGGAGHRHDVTVTAAMFTMLQGNTMVMSLSTAGDTDGHTHGITIACV